MTSKNPPCCYCGNEKRQAYGVFNEDDEMVYACASCIDQRKVKDDE